MAELLAQQRQAHVLAVFIAIADDQRRTAVGERQHRQQLGFAACFEPYATITTLRGSENLFYHPTLLVHLNRVNRGIAALVVHVLHGGVKGTAKLFDAIVKNIAKAHQHR